MDLIQQWATHEILCRLTVREPRVVLALWRDARRRAEESERLGHDVNARTHREAAKILRDRVRRAVEARRDVHDEMRQRVIGAPMKLAS